MGRISEQGSVGKIRNVWGRIVMFKNWHKLVFPFNRFFRGVQQLHLRNGKSVYVREIRSMDLNIVRDILWDHEYGTEKWSPLSPRAIVFDLGANIGTFCIEVMHACPTAQITAYEPHPDNVDILRMNAPSAVIMQKAATEKTGKVHFEDSGAFVGRRVVEQGGIFVDSVSLDDILKDVGKVDLLKIDIEGSEVGLLNAASARTLAKIDRIIMETHSVPGVDGREWVETILAGNGFKIAWMPRFERVVYGYR